MYYKHVHNKVVRTRVWTRGLGGALNTLIIIIRKTTRGFVRIVQSVRREKNIAFRAKSYSRVSAPLVFGKPVIGFPAEFRLNARKIRCRLPFLRPINTCAHCSTSCYTVVYYCVYNKLHVYLSTASSKIRIKNEYVFYRLGKLLLRYKYFTRAWIIRQHLI